MAASLHIGLTLKNRYLIEVELPPGGFGKIYLARDLHVQNRKVVVKTMEGHQVSVDVDWARAHFDNEIKALVRVNHPSVVGVLDMGETPIPYFIMPFVEGESLRVAMSKGRMNLWRIGGIIQQLSQALSAAHEEGITHRDIKPENVLLQNFKSGQENVVLIDFGISSFRDLQKDGPVKLTRVAGTWPYMAPEQLDGLPEFASDTWSLGVLAFELVTGRVPFPASNPLELARRQLAGPVAMPRYLRPDLSLAAEAVILKSLSIDPADRYDSIHKMGEAFLRAVTQTEIDPPTPDEFFDGHVLTVGLANHPDSILEPGKALTALRELLQELPNVKRNSEVLSMQLEDAIALAFNDVSKAIDCAVETASASKDEAVIELRMGIHSGPVQRVSGPRGATFKGSGFSGAMAVMSCADSGQILVSQTTAEHFVGPQKQWLQDLGEHEVAKDLVLHLYNFWTENVGSPKWPKKLAKQNLKPQFSLSEVLAQCRQLFASLDQFLTPRSLRMMFRSERLSEYAYCIPRSMELDLDYLLDCLHRSGRTYKGEALIELLDHLLTIYQSDYRAREIETVKQNAALVLRKRS